MKHPVEEQNVDINNTLDNQKLLENENNTLKQKVKDLEGVCEKLKCEYEKIYWKTKMQICTNL